MVEIFFLRSSILLKDLQFIFFLLEVVLSLLIESFKFSLSDKEIRWKALGNVTPSVVGDPSDHKLPIIIERA